MAPQTVVKAIKEGVESYRRAKEFITNVARETEAEHDVHNLIAELQHDMETAARNLQFEKAIVLRDQIAKLKKSIGRGVEDMRGRKDTKGTKEG